MFGRAMLAFLACPGLVAYAVPGCWVWALPPGRKAAGLAGVLGALFLSAGTWLLLWCVRDFYVSGKGTLAPWAPPETLVRIGLYRVSRNPMYLAVGLVLLGWALAFPIPGLRIYGGAVLVAFHLRVVLGEEPWLARRHGKAWQEYCDQVPRWIRLGRAPAHDGRSG